MTETSIVQTDVKDWAIMKADLDTIGEIVKENAGAGGISPLDLDRVTIPAGGGTQWEVQSLEGVEHKTTIEGIVVYFQDGRVYWEQGFEQGGGLPPTCVSADQVTGVGRPGGECAICPMAQFGSADGGRGQACRTRRDLFLLQQNDLLPIAIQLPVTSFQAARKYFLRLTRSGTPYYGVVTGIGLETTKNQAGIKYSIATFAVTQRLDAKQVEAFKNFSTQLKPSLARASRAVPTDSTDPY